MSHNVNGRVSGVQLRPKTCSLWPNGFQIISSELLFADRTDNIVGMYIEKFSRS